ncbi:MAG: condensation domain-containing protein, partial [Syntrophomonadaceae bacterium]
MNSNIEDIYPLSPMQRGMLFHNLLSKESGVYIEQTSCTFEGIIDIESFKLAWEKIVERHSVLRTAFVWEDVDEPLQIVYKSAVLPFKVLDWQDIPDKEEKLEELLKMEVEEGFDTETAPLMKMAIIKADAGRYYFVWTLHHVLFDGWSAQIIIREVFEFYYSLINKCAFNLKAVRPFRDYISWLQKQDMQKAEAFWRNALKGLMNTTSLRFPAPEKMDGEYLKLQMEINPETSAAVYAFCRKNRLTMNTLIQGLWALILGAYCGEDDVIFGTTVSGRPAELPNIDSTVGLFINTLPVRIKIEPEMNFTSWLGNMQIEQAGQRKFEYCALTDIQGWSQIPREIPLFESIVVFENYPLSQALSRSKDNITIRDLKSHSRTNYPLTIVLGAGEEIAIEVAYDESRFREDDIKALLAHFKVLLSNVSQNAQKKLNEISILSPEEETKILTEFSHGNLRNLDFTCIPELFELIASKYADTAACRMNDLEISYKDLNRKADRLASNLLHNGVTGDTIVALIADRSIEMIVGIMGILKSGGAFLPIDPSYPEERILYMLEDSKAKLILTQSHLLNKIPQVGKKIILMDTEEIYSAEGKPLDVQIYPENLAYIIYTSGSTGKPKGTMLSHKGVVNLSCVQKEVFHLSPGKRILQFSSLSFDASVWEIFMAILNGAALYLCNRDITLSGEKLSDYLKNNLVNVLTVPPSVLSYIPSDLLPNLDILVTAGESATWSLIEKWSKGRKYFNAYGPTEATVCTTLHECSLEDSKDSQTPP